MHAHLVLVPLGLRFGAGFASSGASCHGGRPAQWAELGRGPLHLGKEGVPAVVLELLIRHPLVYLHMTLVDILWLLTL